ncbi:tetratricopeptide repeat protein [Flexibacterium corallicola]|uniref:tetratricopeptide repeat protein n=1 Tax=Flexibacterium corallicola TaxID=3037259 RepID=UPI00286F6FE3|nr:tetratricopeptide repeat protein [Pseudovibrio sp. M1P-2-3]
MRYTDQFGYQLTISDKSRLSSWNKTILAFLAHSSKTPQHMTATLQPPVTFALGHATLGFFNLLLARKELIEVASLSLQNAEKAAKEEALTDRETCYIAALRDWLQGHPSGAADRLDICLKDFPRDALLLKMVHAIRFVLGQPSKMRQSIEQALPSYDQNHPAWGYVKGCYAFTLEETGDYLLAEHMGREAVEVAPDDAWGLHAVAHVYDMTGKPSEGIKWLDTHRNSWIHCNNFGYHVWWHQALMYLDNNDNDRVLDLYDERVRIDKTDDYRDISNAASLLVRLEIAGVPTGNRWEELAVFSENRIDDACNVFADLHYMMCLLGANHLKSASSLTARMAYTAKHDKTDMAQITASTGLPIATGLAAYRDGNYFSAYHNLMHARTTLIDIGGSHAQRDVFERLTIEAALRSGLSLEAKSLLNERKKLRSTSDRYAESRFTLAERMSHASSIMQDETLREKLG